MPIVKHTNEKRLRARRRAQRKAADAERGTARERGYTTAWDNFSRRHLANHPLCVYCKTRGEVTPAQLVDHVIPHDGDPTRFWPAPGDDPATFFVACCRSCHNGPKQRAENLARRSGRDLRLILIKRGLLPREFFGETLPPLDGADRAGRKTRR